MRPRMLTGTAIGRFWMRAATCTKNDYHYHHHYDAVYVYVYV